MDYSKMFLLVLLTVFGIVLLLGGIAWFAGFLFRKIAIRRFWEGEKLLPTRAHDPDARCDPFRPMGMVVFDGFLMCLECLPDQVSLTDDRLVFIPQMELGNGAALKCRRCGHKYGESGLI